MTLDKIIVVKRATQLEELLKRHATASQVKFYLESQGKSYKDYLAEHTAYHEGLKQTKKAIPKTIRQQEVDKEYLASFHFGEKDLVVVVGDDGLVVNVAKYVGEQPVVSVNPDEKRYDGVLSCCNPSTFSGILKKTLDEMVNVQNLTMAEARLDNGQVMYALNDLFIGRKTHISARYDIEYDSEKEKQSSSGIIVSTGTGSTGWMTSVVLGARAIAMDDASLPDEIPFARDADYLLFAVREPFPSKITGTSIVYGEITEDKPLIISSGIAQDGVIFGDGIEHDYLEFNAGRTAEIRVADKKVRLVTYR